MSGELTQRYEDGSSEIRYLEPNRWMLSLPGVIIEDSRETGEPWKMSLAVTGENVSSYLIGRVETTRPVVIVASNQWVKASEHEPVAMSSETGDGSTTVTLEVVLHVTGEDPPQGLRVDCVLV